MNENQKVVVNSTLQPQKKKGKIFIIIGLILVLLLACYIIYIQFFKTDNNVPENNGEKSSSETISSTDETIESNGLFNRSYQYLDEENQKINFIIFNNDGTFFMLDSITCPSGYYGKYSNTNGEITLVSERYYTCNNCYNTLESDNANKSFTLNMLDDEKLSFNNGLETITLVKAVYDYTIFDSLTNDKFKKQCDSNSSY